MPTVVSPIVVDSHLPILCDPGPSATSFVHPHVPQADCRQYQDVDKAASISTVTTNPETLQISAPMCDHDHSRDHACDYHDPNRHNGHASSCQAAAPEYTPETLSTTRTPMHPDAMGHIRHDEKQPAAAGESLPACTCPDDHPSSKLGHMAANAAPAAARAVCAACLNHSAVTSTSKGPSLDSPPCRDAHGADCPINNGHQTQSLDETPTPDECTHLSSSSIAPGHAQPAGSTPERTDDHLSADQGDRTEATKASASNRSTLVGLVAGMSWKKTSSPKQTPPTVAAAILVDDQLSDEAPTKPHCRGHDTDKGAVTDDTQICGQAQQPSASSEAPERGTSADSAASGSSISSSSSRAR